MTRAALLLSTVLLAPALALPAATPATTTTKPAAAATITAKPAAAKPAIVKTIAAKPVVAKPEPVKPLSPQQQSELASLNTAVPSKDGIKRMVILRGLDKITGRASNILAPIGVPVKYATMIITARYCYSTPASEPPETTAFLRIDDHRPDQTERNVFSGWMLASSPSLNGLQHPIYDVWVITCTTNQPGQEMPALASTSAVKAISPNAGANEALPELPEGAGQ